ncbi:hypothetical protein GEK51_07280 [Lacticaseibacillus rhamnosus]|nr:hypothetical protein GEK51_07280 [Lacticaseibacillus rhamnosus]
MTLKKPALHHASKLSVITITRSQGQKPACKDLGRNGQNPTITTKATYTPVSKRPCSRSLKHRSHIRTNEHMI